MPAHASERRIFSARGHVQTALLCPHFHEKILLFRLGNRKEKQADKIRRTATYREKFRFFLIFSPCSHKQNTTFEQK